MQSTLHERGRLEATEAQHALDEIRRATEQTRRAVGRSGTGWVFIIWGSVWLVGFLASQFLPGPQAGILWLGLDILGAIATVAVGMRSARQIRTGHGRRVAALWLTLMVYVGLLVWFAWPLPPDRMTVFMTVGISFGYVFLGIWLSPVLLGTGLGLTALALLGWLLLPAYLGYWMAFLGGGGLIGVGIYILRAWK